MITICRYTEVDYIQSQLDQGFNPVELQNGTTALHQAIIHHNMPVIRLMLKYITSTAVIDDEGNSPLMLSIYHMDLDIVKSIADKDDKIYMGNGNETALTMAIEHGDVDIIKYIHSRYPGSKLYQQRYMLLNALITLLMSDHVNSVEIMTMFVEWSIFEIDDILKYMKKLFRTKDRYVKKLLMAYQYYETESIIFVIYISLSTGQPHIPLNYQHYEILFTLISQNNRYDMIVLNNVHLLFDDTFQYAIKFMRPNEIVDNSPMFYHWVFQSRFHMILQHPHLNVYQHKPVGNKYKTIIDHLATGVNLKPGEYPGHLFHDFVKIIDHLAIFYIRYDQTNIYLHQFITRWYDPKNMSVNQKFRHACVHGDLDIIRKMVKRKKK